MKSGRCLVVCCVLLILTLQGKSQNSANGYLDAVYGKLEKVKDYSVQANIKVDMPFIRMIPVNVKIYFKQKGKFKVESKSIAIVPRQGFDQLSGILADIRMYTAVVQGEEKIGEIQTMMVNVIPLSDTSDIILGKFWIDPVQKLILRSQLTTKSNGTIGTDYTYGSQAVFGLPDAMIFSVDVKKFRIPKVMTSSITAEDKEKSKKSTEKKKGKITIMLSNYKVNTGLPDSVFGK
jgi:hypothetical protein